jgi:hypothetical protein
MMVPPEGNVAIASAIKIQDWKSWTVPVPDDDPPGYFIGKDERNYWKDRESVEGMKIFPCARVGALAF